MCALSVFLLLFGAWFAAQARRQKLVLIILVLVLDVLSGNVTLYDSPRIATSTSRGEEKIYRRHYGNSND